MISLFRRILRCFQLRSPAPSKLARLGVAVASLPFFFVLLMLFHLRVACRGPWKQPAETQFGTRMDCLLPDCVQLYVYLFGVWEPDITSYVRRKLGPGDTFIDVGAHAGYYSLLASRLVGPGGRVVSIEALPFVHDLLERNVALDSVANQNVRVIQAAAGARAGTLAIHRGPTWNLGWSTTLAERGLPHEADVSAAALDDLVSDDEMRAARLIKIDVEGSERDVIAGMTKWLANCRPDAEFLFEMSPLWWRGEDNSLETALAPLLAAGFHAYRVDNVYGPWRYLWPNAVRPPRRVTELQNLRVEQIDLVLSRTDAEKL